MTLVHNLNNQPILIKVSNHKLNNQFILIEVNHHKLNNQPILIKVSSHKLNNHKLLHITIRIEPLRIQLKHHKTKPTTRSKTNKRLLAGVKVQMHLLPRETSTGITNIIRDDFQLENIHKILINV